jgi:outer membrane lipoprotein SlyB
MKHLIRSAPRTLLFAAVLATGSAPFAAQAANQNGNHHKAEARCHSCGTVVSTHTYVREPARASGLGAVGGAVVGGLLGNQVGSGNGRTLATVAGAVGGSYAGNRVERNMHAQTVTDVRVRMADGQVRTFTEVGQSRFRNGASVRVTEKGLVRD